jgi:gliding motility-associated lipoprotein GldH
MYCNPIESESIKMSKARPLFLHKHSVLKQLFIATLAGCLMLTACTTVDLYEKVEPIPGHNWKSTFKPSFTFTIKDTTSAYQLYVLVRHSNQYNYNNLWVNLHTQSPDGTVSKAQYELPLATAEKGWLGTGMDDLYEHRIALTPLHQNFFFKRAGDYTFTLEQIMREDPLEHVLNIGLRIEKKPR